MLIFANLYPKAHKEERLIRSKAQRSTKKTEEQRKKCKWKPSAAKRKSVAKYKFTAEYSFTVEYCFLAGWFRQMKINWAQCPFDPVNIIWPTKAQILLYKKIGMKTDIMKRNKERQEVLAAGIAWRESQTKGNDKCSRKHMKKQDKNTQQTKQN